MIKNRLLNSLVIGLTLALCAHVMAEPAPLEDLDTLVKIHATEAKLTKPSSAARNVLIVEMDKYPEQLAKDIHRQSAINIMLKDSIPNDILAKMKGKTDMEIYEAIASTLHRIYVSETDKTTQKNKLGKFFMAELLYPLVQNFNSVPLLKFNQDHPDLTIWQAPGGDPSIKFWVDFIYSPDNNTLYTVSNSEKSLMDTTGADSSRKKFHITSTAAFDLDSGKVTLSFSYNFDGLKKEWTNNDPFSASISIGQRLKDAFRIK